MGQHIYYSEVALHSFSYKKVFWDMQQIYRRIPMPKFNFNKNENQLLKKNPLHFRILRCNFINIDSLLLTLLQFTV